MKAQNDLTDIVGDAVYSQIAPDNLSWPFVKLGAISSEPMRAACLDGSEFRLTVHAFAKATPDETAEDHCSRLSAIIERTCDGAKLAIADNTLPDFSEGSHLALSLIGTQLLVDSGEAGAFHAVIDFRGRAFA